MGNGSGCTTATQVPAGHYAAIPMWARGTGRPSASLCARDSYRANTELSQEQEQRLRNNLI
ncbi:LOXL4 [Cervus elaphus hippelaphus]|uniref:LOXL4 n=1 Tax=Cervus elaphus hippelaphus TaxID=46360 RepID=A0A212CQ63_CEREH|nr:LOXL4 [Cervus elaphus hippelaphus]